MDWSHSWAPFSECSGGTAANGGNYQRASDPWISFAPNGDAYQISISFDQTTNRSSVLVSKSSNGGDTWSDPTTLILDNFLNVFNDKESITADATTPDGSHAYAVWDRFVSPSQNVHSLEGAENSRGFKQPVWFSRTTNGGRSWEAARAIFDAGDQTATEGNQIVVLPDGTLIDGFVLFSAHKDAAGILGDSIAVIRSTDKGLDWSHAIIVDKAFPVGIVDPNTGVRLRTGGDLPEFAVDPHSGALYAVWADGRFTNFTQPEIAFSMSTDGGLHWTPAVRVNKTPTGPAFTPMVRVAADGTVGVTYYDFRNNVVGLGNPLPTDAWMVHCHSACTDPGNWSETHVGGPFDEQQAPVTGRRGYFVGDYEGLTVAPNGGLRPFFAMALPGTLADRTNIFTNRVGP